MAISGKFCPVCKKKNKITADVCEYCGTKFGGERTEHMSTTRNTDSISLLKTSLPLSIVNEDLIPNDGLAIYAPGDSKTYYLHIYKQLVLGRKVEPNSDTFLDLEELDGYNLGVSRRHALIREAASGFEIMDLSSTNGTWVNDERLKPEKPYRLVNGSQLRLGRLRLFTIFHSGHKNG